MFYAVKSDVQKVDVKSKQWDTVNSMAAATQDSKMKDEDVQGKIWFFAGTQIDNRQVRNALEYFMLYA